MERPSLQGRMLSRRSYAWVVVYVCAVYFVSQRSQCTSLSTKNITVQQHHGHHRGLSLEDMAREAATSTSTSHDHPAVVFTMGYHDFLISALPVLLASLAATDPAEMLGQRLIVGVDSEGDLELCQQVHRIRRCWLDDKLTVHHEPSPERDSWQPRRLISTGWRKLEIVQHLVGLGFGVFAADIDLIFLRNPFPFCNTLRFHGKSSWYNAKPQMKQEPGQWNLVTLTSDSTTLRPQKHPSIFSPNGFWTKLSGIKGHYRRF